MSGAPTRLFRLRVRGIEFGASWLLPALAVLGGAVPEPVQAQVKKVSLTAALSRLARETHMELLFDERLVGGRIASPDPKGRDPERRLRSILADTGFTFRRSPTGAYLIIAAPRPRPAERGAPVPVTEPPIADILVVGSRTLNADIRRDPDDIQAYQVFDGKTIERSQSSTLGAFLREDYLQNRQTRGLEQTPLVAQGSVRSQVDVHGLGTEQTLVLINGRRLPRIAAQGGFVQPDVNGVPLYAIDRIETIGTTAGGIFGIGAGGGAVNIVTKSDFADLSLTVRSGLTERGDAAERGLSLHLGWTSPNGHTRVSARVSGSASNGLTFGDRTYVEDALLLRRARNPNAQLLPVSGSINISGAGQTLTLLPGYGGTVLTGSTTILPLDAPAVGSGGAAILAANAGRLDFSLSPDGQGNLQTFVTPTKTRSALFNIRQDIGDHVVLFADYLRLQSDGVATTPAVSTLNTFLAPGQSGNPFSQAILLTFPTAGLLGTSRDRTSTDRFTLGAILSLAHGWSASIDVAAGHSSVRESSDDAQVTPSSFNVFAGPAALAAQLAAVDVKRNVSSLAVNRLHDLNLKIAGSPLTLPAGRLYLTLTGELREERSPGEVDERTATASRPASILVIGGQREQVASAFLEVRAPLVSADSPVFLARGLELQLAFRHDRYALTVPVKNANLVTMGLFGPTVTARGDVTAVTAGFHVRPLRGLTLRASFANGYTPPTAAQITPDGFNNYTFFFDDPKRGGTPVFSLDRTFQVFAGSPTLKPQLARTFSAGAIVEPDFAPGLRLAVDFGRLETSREIGDYAAFDAQYFIDHEAAYPGRVVRAPLTPSDIAQGFTAGRIIVVDSTYLTVGRSTLQVVDFALDYSRATSFGGLHFFAKASWEPTLDRRGNPDLPAYNSVNSITGPLSIRGNAGVDWSKGPWSAGLNAQAYGGYRVTYAYQPGSVYEGGYLGSNKTAILEQGGAGVPAEAYLDGYVSWSLGAGNAAHHARELSIRLGIKNLLDKRPPVAISTIGQVLNSLGYSLYGDPRGRRFVLDVSTKF